MSEENTPPVAQPEFEAVTEVCPPGANPVPASVKAKRAKAVAKRYYVTQGLESRLEDQTYHHFCVVNGSEDGFRTWEETAKFIRTLPPGKYAPISVPSKSIEIVETTTTKIKGL